MVEIEFHGAAKTVTGSNYVVRTDKGTFVVDCGMFQGIDVEARNLQDYAYDPSEVDFALLTHAHIDHSGMLPKLYKHGFRGDIYATPNTIHLTELLLLDSAKIQENNYKRGMPYGKHVKDVTLVYNTYDAVETINKLKAAEFNQQFEPMPGIKINFLVAGHILGAASIEVEIEDGDVTKTILFSGDIGREQPKLIPSYDHEDKSKPDYILMESLYGGEFHPNRNDSVQDMLNAINETMDKGGTAFIPVFSVQRSQEIMHDIKLAQQNGDIDPNIPVYLDSPLAQKVSTIYLNALGDDPNANFLFDNLRFIKKYRDSLQLAKRSKQIVLAGSGMADGGRILEHFTTGLANPKNSAIFVGFQAEGTIGREIVDGAKEVVIGKNNVKVNASIYHLHGFSAHGDTADYLNFLNRHNSDKLKKLFLIHAEEDRARELDEHLEKIGIGNDRTYIPDWKEVQKL